MGGIAIASGNAGIETLMLGLDITQVCGAHLFGLLTSQLLQSGRFDRLLTLTTVG